MRGFARRLREEAPRWSVILPQLPRLVHRALEGEPAGRLEQALDRIAEEQRRQANVLRAIAILLAVLVVAALLVIPA